MCSANRVDGSRVLRAAGGVLRRSAGDETVLLDLDSEEFFGLDQVGAEVFELLKQPRSLDELVDTLGAEYDIDRETLEQDIRALLAELIDCKLVVDA